MTRALSCFSAFCAVACAIGPNPSTNLAILWLAAAVAATAFTRRA